jgi:hypothetical protein
MAGTKNDQGKAPFHLLSGPALWAVAEVLEYGRQKYAARNWEDGISYSRLFAALQRHLWEWWSGVKRDDESGLHALAHAMCDIMFLLHYELRYEGALERSKFQIRLSVTPTGVCPTRTSRSTTAPSSTTSHFPSRHEQLREVQRRLAEETGLRMTWARRQSLEELEQKLLNS